MGRLVPRVLPERPVLRRVLLMLKVLQVRPARRAKPGPEGNEGKEGPTGPTRSQRRRRATLDNAGGTLPSKATETGVWAYGEISGAPGELDVPISLPIPLSSRLEGEQVH